jgi:hypothetical protein
MEDSKAASPPIFVWEPRDLTIFASVEAACGYLEAEYFREGIPAFDSAGRRLLFGTAKVPVKAFGKVLWNRVVTALVECESEPTHADDLRAILIDALHLPGATSMTLPELVEAAEADFGLTS